MQQSASTRRRKAYWVSFKVAMSYLWLYLVAKFRGKHYWSTQIKEVNRRNAERIKDVMLELQGLFIKFGQLISILSNVLPDEFRKPLEELQDNVPPHPFSEIEAVIQKELGKPSSDIFTQIEPQPIAAASIGQVHRAKIGDEDVVVKIQHPKIDELVHVDLTIIKKIVSLVARFMKIKGVEHLYQQVEQMIEEELNYYQEAQSMQLIQKNLSTEAMIRVPKVYEQYSSKKILTIEYCEGVKISNLEQLKNWGHDLDALTDLFVRVYCQMILVDGFYHADPHPGNVLVNEQGQIVLLDFGAVARLSKEMKDGIPKLLECIIKQDAEEMVKVLRKLGFIAHGDSVAKMAEKLIDDVQDFVHNELQLESLNVQNISPEQLKQALQLINIKEMTQIMQIPKDWVLLNRAVVLVSGVAFLLQPNWNPVDTLQPYLKKQLEEREGGFTQMLVNTIKTQLNTMVILPLELQKVLRKANKGKLELEVKSMKRGLKGIQLVGQQLVWLIWFLVATYYYLSLNSFSYPKLHTLFQLMGLVSFMGFWWSFFRTSK